MDPMQDQNSLAEFEQVYSLNKSADDMIFDQIVMELQEILINPQFQNILTEFMRNNWNNFDGNGEKQIEAKVFAEYRNQMRIYIQKAISKKIPEFDWNKFNILLKTRKNIMDQQIMDTLLSFEDVETFNMFIQDYRISHQEQEMLKVLTVKSNKIAQNKAVKGKDNIFLGVNRGPMFDKGLKAPLPKKKETKEKTEGQLLVPQLILTVKPLRKG